MASRLKQEDRLDELAAAVRRLRGELVAREREAGELLDGEEAATLASNMVAATRLMLEAAKDRYFDETEAARADVCPIHGSAVLVMCPDCVARNPMLQPNHDAYLAAVRAEGQAA